MALVALQKIRLPEFNQNIVIDKHPALIIDSMNLHYNIIFGADSLDKCNITLNYENHQLQWMEYTIPLRNASKFFLFNYYTSILAPLELESEHNFIGNPVVDTFAMQILDTKYEQANIHDVSFDQHHHLLDQCQNLFNILIKHKKIFELPWSLSL